MSCALALATTGGIAAGTSPPASATSFSAAFLFSDDVSAVRLCLRCAYRFQLRVPCLTDLVAVTVSDLELAASVAAVVQDTPAAKRDPAACSQRGKKWESSGNTGRKQGKALWPLEICRLFAFANPSRHRCQGYRQGC